MPSPLPTAPPFDLCFVSGTALASLFTYTGVTYGGDLAQFTVGAAAVTLGSGGAADTTDLRLYVAAAVPSPFTFEAVLSLEALPANFTSLVLEHVYLGASTTAGPTFGLFFSQVGLAYAGSIHHDGAGTLVLDSALQLLPDSQNYVPLGVPLTVRVASDAGTGATYVYVTPTAEVLTRGHRLVYVLPTLAAGHMAQTPTEELQVSVRGLAARPAQITLYELALGTGLLIPVVMPRADAGNDQSVRTCQIVQLDGSRSFDPQGGRLTYLWQLVNAPLGSAFLFDGYDGQTFPLPTPTGFTHKFYAASLGVLDGQTAIVLGSDLLSVQGASYVITAVGTDGGGFFVAIAQDDLPDSLPSGTVFAFLPQRGISGATNAKATFFPDVSGLFTFNLLVSNGALASLPAETIVNVTASFLPRGLIPDMTFLWGYLSDFWKLLDDPGRIEVFWSALAQCISAELLSLWQVDYAKSLRDVQRTFQRRWLHYDLALNERTALVELSSVTAVFGGIATADIPLAGASGVAGTFLDLLLYLQATPVRVTFGGSDPQTAQQIANALNDALLGIDSRITARVLTNHAGTQQRVQLDAPFLITVAASSTFSLLTGVNGLAQGTGGSVSGTRGYRVERSLSLTPLTPGTYLTVAGGAAGAQTVRVLSVVDDASDPYAFQRLVLQDALAADAGSTWVLSGQVTSPSLDFYAGLVEGGDSVTLEVIDTATQQILTVAIPVVGVCAATPQVAGVDASAVGQYLSDPRYEVFFLKAVRRQYTPIDPLVLDVPYLQEIINSADDSQVLRRNLDYFVDVFRGAPCIRFVVNADPARDVWEGQTPPDRMWAEVSYIDNRPRIEANFGIPAEFTLDDLSLLPSNVDYLSAVSGLWYSYFNGPTVANLRVGAQILLGLPYAAEAGTILEIRTDFSSTSGRLLVQDTQNEEVVRADTVPAALGMEVNPATKQPYVVGDAVAQFAPLVQGVEVLDYVNSPRWFAGLLAQGTFKEVEKYAKFMVKVSSQAFNLNALLFVQNFIRRIKPTYTLPIFFVQESLPPTDIVVTDAVTLSGRLSLAESPALLNPSGIGAFFDHVRPAGGASWGKYDTSALAAPTAPFPTLPVAPGFDRPFNSPDNFIAATAQQTVAAGVPAFDGIFTYDLPLFTNKIATFGEHSIHAVPSTDPGISLGTVVLGGASSCSHIYVEYSGDNGGLNPYTLELMSHGGGANASFSLPLGVSGRNYTIITAALSFAAADPLEASLVAPAEDALPWLHDIMVVLGTATPWAFDTVLSAGTYQRFRSL